MPSPAAMKSAAVESTYKARLPAGGKSTDVATVIKTTERAGACSRLGVRRGSSADIYISFRGFAIVERVFAAAAEAVAIRNCSAV